MQLAHGAGCQRDQDPRFAPNGSGERGNTFEKNAFVFACCCGDFCVYCMRRRRQQQFPGFFHEAGFFRRFLRTIRFVFRTGSILDAEPSSSKRSFFSCGSLLAYGEFFTGRCAVRGIFQIIVYREPKPRHCEKQSAVLILRLTESAERPIMKRPQHRVSLCGAEGKG